VSRPSTLRTTTLFYYGFGFQGAAMSTTLTKSMNLCNKVFSSERVSVLASTFAKTEDIWSSKISCLLSIAFILATPLPK
jgi:hypothetical protein